MAAMDACTYPIYVHHWGSRHIPRIFYRADSLSGCVRNAVAHHWDGELKNLKAWPREE